MPNIISKENRYPKRNFKNILEIIKKQRLNSVRLKYLGKKQSRVGIRNAEFADGNQETNNEKIYCFFALLDDAAIALFV